MPTQDADSRVQVVLPINSSRFVNLEREAETKADDIRALQEEPINVTFVLPDDSLITHTFRKGQTVQVLKSFLEVEFDFTQANTVEGILEVQRKVEGADASIYRRLTSRTDRIASVIMPYQVLPGIVIISAAFTLMGVGFGAVNKWQARREHQETANAGVS
ncbi:hypothetical protein P43SY_008435 [Pythium insidiosum]|uniref:Uncharacterized protein n=1 Tax=Pythium insidiosum TaxID=114742 RepID=A0AAD5LE00_PYTIN|nr:hypothetical protein P43SY_008435 [Pythium insidiosum]KAJ0399177.1 hypothetical protein ATCC90586_001811 [Pythium insidiosum]